MKYMFVSDIHGNIDVLENIIKIFEEEKADKLIILGDTSASNLEDNEIIANMLNNMSDKLEVIEGNCDNNMLLDRLNFEAFDIDNLYLGENIITITHGNGYNMYNLPPFCGNIFIQGHTHVPVLKEQNGVIIANPGSITHPRGADLRCYIIVDETKVYLKSINGSIVAENDVAQDKSEEM